MSEAGSNRIATAETWREASHQARRERAERLRLPSGATILAARPEPIEWILAGRLPQQLLGAALEGSSLGTAAPREMTREEVLELARFAEQMVKAAIIEPRIGEGLGEIPFDEIPVCDRAFIFEWACRAWSADRPAPVENSGKEGQPIPQNGIERFRSE
jgi:hypothetical protein